jgi:hypothetical protein
MIANVTKSRSEVIADGTSTWTIGFDVTALTTTIDTATISIKIGSITKEVSVSQLADGTANCYMVTPGSTVDIPITRAITIGGMNASDIANVNTLWDDNGVISNTMLSSGSGASRTITVNASSKPGNAVVALKDAVGTIYWSWHIWVTDYNGSITWTNPNNTAYTFMDRNLGATEAALSLAGRGLFYQWGRKDPFPGGKAGTAGHAALDKFYGMPDAGSPDVVHVTNTAENAIGIADGILESIRKPTTFFIYEDAWYKVWLPTPVNTLWNTNENTKTVYDPCPNGWRVPIGDNKIPWDGLPWQNYEIGEDAGVDWSNPVGSNNGLYPAAGLRANYTGEIKDADVSGRYTCVYRGSSLLTNTLYIRPGREGIWAAEYICHAFGMSVRCMQD